MALKTTTWILVASSLVALVSGGVAVAAETHATTPLERTLTTEADGNAPRTAEQQALVDFAYERFESHNLELPEIQIQFHPSLETCGWHKGLYVEQTHSLHMCSLDTMTMLHEMAHAWANLNLTSKHKQAFADHRGLDGWNDHDEAWEVRATEHVAETIAWGLIDRPTHVRWVETDRNGGKEVSYRLLSIDTDVETLVDNFAWLTGQTPGFRSAAEWPSENVADFSPEASR